ncbi:MAG: hypothetical protein AAGA65_18535 [Actinomycetota bacterium]
MTVAPGAHTGSRRWRPGRPGVRGTLIAVVAAAALLLVSCGGSDGAVDGDAAASEAAEATAVPETRQVVLDLALPTYDGDVFDPASINGKPVILWFWGAF